MKILTAIALFTAVQATAMTLQCAAGDAVGRALFADDFSKSGVKKDTIGLGWNIHFNGSAKTQVAIRDGHLRFHGEDSSSLSIYRYTDFIRGGVSLRFKLDDLGDQLSIAFRDNLFVEVPNGKLLSLDLHPRGLRLFSYLPDGSSTVTKKDMEIVARRWHGLKIAIDGERLVVTIKNQPPVEIDMAALKRTKSELRITGSGNVAIDDLEITSLDPKYDLNALPGGLIVTKRTEQAFDRIGASDQQKRRLQELIAAHRGYVYALREQAGFSDTDLIGKRDEAVQEARKQRLEGDAIWAHVQKHAGLSDMQREAFRVTFERHNQFRSESLALLTAQQREQAAKSKRKAKR